MGGIYWNLYPFPVDNHNFSVIISNPNTKEQMSQTFTVTFNERTGGFINPPIKCTGTKSTFLNDTFKWDGNIVESPPKWGTCP